MAREMAIPRRVLVVDGDAAGRSVASALLIDGDFQVATAVDGEQGLSLLGREWFPVVIADRTLPGMDGLQFALHLRASAIDPIYMIMLTASDSPQDYEQGYCAGIDFYLSKKNCEKELLARVNAGVFAIKRRRASRPSNVEGMVVIDLDSGAHTARHLVGRLRAEIVNAVRRRRPLSIVSVSVESESETTALPEGTVANALQAIQASIRARMDWIACLPATRSAHRFAVVLPEADATEVATVERLIQGSFRAPEQGGAPGRVRLSFGSTVQTFVTDTNLPTALELLGIADRSRRAEKSSPGVPGSGATATRAAKSA